LKYEFLATR